ncbi:methyltransferase domain-containing protein [Singulisphaera sp. Ch08]|uniref:Methyltransferase domain-containing protein n=1 Tax=Singulisphaera sp. Ch08 TaxID=3120278 RepID=A0AAU7CC07_9BACT
MTVCHEAEVAAQFDRQQQRFKATVAVDDVRLGALRNRLEPLLGRRILDLGCGKGRFARPLAEAGAEMIGLDLSAAMLADARGIARVRGSARRLPFAAGSFDAVIAVEVFEHLAAIDDVLNEARRVLRPGGILAIVDKNAGALNADRPWLPGLVVKRIDEMRGLWMYPLNSPVRERWFWPGRFRNHLGRWFENVQVDHILSPKEADRRLFRQIPRARLMTLWTARVAGSLV